MLNNFNKTEQIIFQKSKLPLAKNLDFRQLFQNLVFQLWVTYPLKVQHKENVHPTFFQYFHLNSFVK
jgi:hypothetical protein